MSDLTPEKAAALRKPFDKAQIGVLPKPYKADSPKGNCKECGQYHGLPAVHLDYVGHAATTDRLLQVDPAWSWEPFAVDGDGLPAMDKAGNLWIKLTVCGVTRIGVGDGKTMKERIGDAIRNAAMRFGVALDLWAKEDLHADKEPEPVKQEEPRPVTTLRPQRAAVPPLEVARARLIEASFKVKPEKVSPAERNAYIGAAIAARGMSSTDPMDLGKLADEWEDSLV